MIVICKQCSAELDTIKVPDKGLECQCGALRLMMDGNGGTWLAGDPELASTDEHEFVEPREGFEVVMHGRCGCGREAFLHQGGDGSEFAILKGSTVTVKCPDCSGVFLINKVDRVMSLRDHETIEIVGEDE